MNSLPKVAAPSRGTTGLALVRRVSGVPFPYVVLGGRDDVSADAGGAAESEASGAENQRAWFAAHVELSAPRWGDAREALVRSLAIPDANAAVAPAQDDAAWDDGATAAPILKEAPVAVVQPPPIKLRAKRRAPTLETTPAVAVPVKQSVASGPDESGFPLLAEGLAPLVPIPGLGSQAAPVAPLRMMDLAPVPLPAPAPARARPAGGRFQKVIGMVLLCALLGVAGFVLFQEFLSPGAKNSAQAAVGEVGPAPAPAASLPVAVAPQAVEPALTPEVAAAAMPAGPVRASAAFESYVAGLRVSGVSLGASPRALINGRMVHLGDLIDPALGVRLVAVDGVARHLVFEDGSTARVQARY